MVENTVGKKEKLLVTSNFSFSHSVFKRLVLQTRKNKGLFGKGLTLYRIIATFNTTGELVKPCPKQQILNSSKLRQSADDNFEFDEKSRKFSKRVENTGKRRNCSLRAISPFSAVFSKDMYCRHVKTRACLGKG